MTTEATPTPEPGKPFVVPEAPEAPAAEPPAKDVEELPDHVSPANPTAEAEAKAAADKAAADKAAADKAAADKAAADKAAADKAAADKANEPPKDKRGNEGNIGNRGNRGKVAHPIE